MKKEVSNSMSIENDPHFDVITPICIVCKNYNIEKSVCKEYDDIPLDFKYAKRYDCPKRDIDKANYWYDNVRNKLE